MYELLLEISGRNLSESSLGVRSLVEQNGEDEELPVQVILNRIASVFSKWEK
jgi:hypothetical protein